MTLPFQTYVPKMIISHQWLSTLEYVILGLNTKLYEITDSIILILFLIHIIMITIL
jgi:hypothetical protein